MKTKTIILSFLISLICTVYSQNEKNNWHFGYNAGITFNTNPPSYIMSGSTQQEGSSSISDAAGNTILYGGGNKLYDNTSLISNTLNGSHISAQSFLIAPSPASANQYYVFTMNDWVTSGPGLSYTLVDMSLNQGNNILPNQSNIIVNTNSREQLAAVYHANCKDIWIICHEGGKNVAANNNYLAYLLTDQGLQTSPVISSVGMTYSGGNRYGSIKSSKSGDQLCSALGGTSNGTTVELLDFDNATGVISNPVVIADNSQASTAYSSEFSPDGTKLYVTAYNQGDIFQYDITSGNSATIMSSKIVITTGPGNNSSMQIGPDDKIYVSRYNAKYLGVINFPDVAGTNCNYDPSGVYLNNGKCMLGLPNFVQGCGGYNTAPSTCQAIFKETITCDTTFFYDYSSISANASVVSWHWDFGDGTTSTQQNPIHIYANNAYYNVCLTITTSDSCSSTTCKTIYYNCPSQPSSCQASYYSYPDTVFDCHTTYFADNSTATSNIVSWSWDFGDGTNSYLQNPTHTYAANGIYSACLTIMTADSCASTYCDTITINCSQVPSSCQASFNTHLDTSDCHTTYFVDNSIATSNIVSWSWDFGDGTNSYFQNPTHTYVADGIYNVCLTIMTADSCVSTYCDTITIICSPMPSSCQAGFILWVDSINCNTAHFANTSTASSNIVSWSWAFGDGGTSNISSPTHTYAANGTYNVCLTIMTADSCVSTYCDTITIICGPMPSSCQANFYSHLDCYDCYTAYFVDTSTASSNIVSWSWDFGDGTNSYLQYPMHTYAAVGIYNVCLTIMTADSCMSTYCDTVSISCNPQPQCQAGFYPDIDTTNCFTAYFYNNSTASSNILAWNWSFGDGNMSSLQHPTHVYTANGTYTVCLNIVAADGCTSTYCDTIVISCVITPPCQANFTAILDTNAGNNMTFNFINQSTSQTPIIYQLWDYGDGNLTTAPNPTYTYASSGSYQVCLTILTMDSCTSDYCDSVYIAMTSSINDIFMDGKLSIFPNPANSTVQVTFDVPNGQEYDLVMFNVTGQAVRRMHDFYNGAVKIERNELSKGLYFIEVEVNGQINRGKLIFK